MGGVGFEGAAVGAVGLEGVGGVGLGRVAVGKVDSVGAAVGGIGLPCNLMKAKEARISQCQSHAMVNHRHIVFPI